MNRQIRQRIIRGIALCGGLSGWTVLVGFGLGWEMWLWVSGRVNAPWTVASCLLLTGFLLLTAGAWVVGVRRIKPVRWGTVDDATLAIMAASVLVLGIILGKNSTSAGQGVMVLFETLLLLAGGFLFRQVQQKGGNPHGT